jgi:hypothetical protein
MGTILPFRIIIQSGYTQFPLADRSWKQAYINDFNELTKNLLMFVEFFMCVVRLPNT